MEMPCSGGTAAECCGASLAGPWQGVMWACCAPVWGVQGISSGEAERCCSPAEKCCTLQAQRMPCREPADRSKQPLKP